MVKRSCWFVGEDDFWLVNECTGNAHTLTLATGKFVGQPMKFIFQAQFDKKLFSTLFRCGRNRQNVFERREIAEKKGLLEDKAKTFLSEFCPLLIIKGLQVTTVVEDRSTRRVFESR
jgi:hypothetical protein